MATPVTVTVKTSGGDYTTLAAAIAGEAADLVSSDEQLTIELYGSVLDTASTDVTGFTTDATRYIDITSVVNHGGTWSTSPYRLVVASVFNTLIVQENYTRVRGVQIEVQGSGNYAPKGIACFGTHPRIERCIIRCTYSGTNTSAINWGIDLATGGGTSPAYASNNIVYGFDGADAGSGEGRGINTGSVAAYVFNNTCYGNLTGIKEAGGNSCRAINNLCASNSTADFNGAWHADTDYNAASDATAPGTNSRDSQTFTFVSTTGGSEDFHLTSSDAGARGYGSDLSSHVTYPISVDVDDAARIGTWDIGADQFGIVIGPSRGVVTLIGTQPILVTPLSFYPIAGVITLTGGPLSGNYPKTNRIALLGIG